MSQPWDITQKLVENSCLHYTGVEKKRLILNSVVHKLHFGLAPFQLSSHDGIDFVL